MGLMEVKRGRVTVTPPGSVVVKNESRVVVNGRTEGHRRTEVPTKRGRYRVVEEGPTTSRRLEGRYQRSTNRIV